MERLAAEDPAAKIRYTAPTPADLGESMARDRALQEAVQQTLTQYPQVSTVYTPGTGYFPLSPWAGFAVLCAWTAAALALALFLLRRRDA